MANPYSVAANVTYSPLDLSPFADLIDKKETAYQTTLAGLSAAKPNLLVQPGMSTEAEAARANEKYLPQLTKITEDLITTKDYNKAAQAMVALQSQFESDRDVQLAKFDAAISPTVREMMMKNQNGYFGFTDTGTYDGKVKPLPEGATINDLENRYMEMYAGPNFRADYGEWHKSLPADIQEELRTGFKTIYTPDGTPVLAFQDGTVITESKQVMDYIKDRGLMNMLRTEYDNQSSNTALFYNKARSFEEFTTDYIKTFAPTDYTKKTTNVRTVPYLNTDGSGKTKTGGTTDDGSYHYKVKRQQVGNKQLTQFEGDIHQVPKDYEQAEQDVLDGKLSASDPKFRLLARMNSEYQAALKRHNEQVKHLWDEYKSSNGLNEEDIEILTAYKNAPKTTKVPLGTAGEVDVPIDEEKLMFSIIRNKTGKNPNKLTVERYLNTYTGFETLGNELDQRFKDNIADLQSSITAYSISDEGSGKAVKESNRVDFSNAVKQDRTKLDFNSAQIFTSVGSKNTKLKNNKEDQYLEKGLNLTQWDDLLSKGEFTGDITLIDSDEGPTFGFTVTIPDPRDSNKKREFQIQAKLNDNGFEEFMNDPLNPFRAIYDRFTDGALVGSGEKPQRRSDLAASGNNITNDVIWEGIINRIPTTSGNRINTKKELDVIIPALESIGSKWAGYPVQVREEVKKSSKFGFEYANPSSSIMDDYSEKVYINLDNGRVDVDAVYNTWFKKYEKSSIPTTVDNVNNLMFVVNFVDVLKNSNAITEDEAVELINKAEAGSLKGSDLKQSLEGVRNIPFYFANKEFATSWMMVGKK